MWLGLEEERMSLIWECFVRREEKKYRIGQEDVMKSNRVFKV